MALLFYDFLDKSYGRKDHACQWNRRRVAMKQNKNICVCFCVGVFVCVRGVTFSFHAHSQTLLEAAERASFPLGKVHRAALLFCTGVMLVVLH